MKISCEEAATICNKAQYKESSLWEVIKLQLHTLYCKTCAKYSRKNGAFTKLCKKANLHVLEEKEKQVMKKELQKQL